MEKTTTGKGYRASYVQSQRDRELNKRSIRVVKADNGYIEKRADKQLIHQDIDKLFASMRAFFEGK